MKEQIISFDVAKLAKEKGFPQNFSYAQFINMGKGEWKFCNREDADNLDDSIGIGKNIRCSAPTQSLLQKWLREVHGIHIQVYTMERWLESGNDMEIYFEVNLKTTNSLNGLSNVKFNMLTFKTYEEALEKGLQEALKLIKV